MFNRNINALQKRDPALAKLLSETSLPEITAFQNESGDFNLEYNGVALHSEVDPLLESKEIFAPKAEKDKSSNINIIFGLGMGYLFKRACVSSIGRIVLYEPFLDILRFTLEYVDFSNEIEQNRIFICNDIKSLLDVLNKKYIVGDHLEISYLPAYTKFAAAEFNQFTDAVMKFIESRQIDQNTILKRAEHWGLLSFLNLPTLLDAYNVDCLKGIFPEKPIVIASAGPSLQDDIPVLKKHRDKFTLFTVNTALKALLNNDLIPDFCLTTESIYLDKQFNNLKNLEKVNFIFHPRTQPFAWRAIERKNTFYMLTKTDGFSTWFNGLAENKYQLYPSASSVSIMAFYLAFKLFENQNIILVGQDLAFTDSKMYADDALLENETIEIVDQKIKSTAEKDVKKAYLEDLELVNVRGNNDEILLTRKDYAEFINQFEEIIAKEVPKTINVINTAVKGAKIPGAACKSLEETLKSMKVESIDVSAQLETLLITAKKDKEETRNLLLPKLQTFCEELKSNQKKAQQLLGMLDIFEKRKDANADDTILSNLISNYYTMKTPLFDYISKQEFVFFIIQKDMIDYINSFVRPEDGSSTLTLDQHKQNMAFEKKLLVKVNDVLSRLCTICENELLAKA